MTIENYSLRRFNMADPVLIYMYVRRSTIPQSKKDMPGTSPFTITHSLCGRTPSELIELCARETIFSSTHYFEDADNYSPAASQTEQLCNWVTPVIEAHLEGRSLTNMTSNGSATELISGDTFHDIADLEDEQMLIQPQIICNVCNRLHLAWIEQCRHRNEPSSRSKCQLHSSCNRHILLTARC